jgi:hypothetical protein
MTCGAITNFRKLRNMFGWPLMICWYQISLKSAIWFKHRNGGQKIYPTISWPKSPRTVYILHDVTVWTFSANHFETLQDFPQRAAEIVSSQFSCLSLSHPEIAAFTIFIWKQLHLFLSNQAHSWSCKIMLLRRTHECSNIMCHC